MKEMTVSRIEIASYRKLLYGNDSEYYVIAHLDSDVRIGDRIEYESGGMNFGWFARIAECPQRLRESPHER